MTSILYHSRDNDGYIFLFHGLHPTKNNGSGEYTRKSLNPCEMETMATESMRIGSHGNGIAAKWRPWQQDRCEMETMATELMRNGNHGYRIDPIGNHGNRTDANWMPWQQNNAKSKPWQQNRCKLEAMATGSMWNGNHGNWIWRRERLNIFIWD